MGAQEHAGAVTLPQALRDQLRLDPQLGAGNFFHHAYRVNPNVSTPFIQMDAELVTLGGQRATKFSLASLKEVVDRYAAWYASKGVCPHDPVAVYLGEGAGYLIHYIALTGLGAIPILTNGNMDPAVAARHFTRTGAVGVYTDAARYDALAPVLDHSAFNFVVHDGLAEPAATGVPEWYPYRHAEDDPIMITHSSGTTGVPKAVLLQHGKWFYGIRHLLGLSRPQGVERILSSLPSSHNAAIAYAMYSILNGSELVLVSDRSGAAVLRAIDQFAPSTVVSFPQTYVEMCDVDMDQFNLDSINMWINSGDAAHETHIRQLVRFGHHYRGVVRVDGSQFIDGLGSSEMGHSLFRVIHTPYTNNYDRCVGIPQKWIQAAVIDDQGSELPPGKVGKLGVKGETVTAGYWNDSVLTYRSRRGEYFLTGDMVYQDELGCFYHVDRIPDVVHTRVGPLYSLQTEELLMKHFPEVADCTVIALPADGRHSHAVAIARLKPGSEPEDASLLERFNSLLVGKAWPLLHDVMISADIPLGVTGKVLKRELRERYRERYPLRQIA